MCPDDQVLSLYFDKELPAPWKGKFEAHLGSCPECQLHLRQYTKLREILKEDQVTVSEEIKNRVWDKVYESEIYSGPEEPLYTQEHRKRHTPVKAFWNHTVTLPLPAAAAAAAAFIIITFLAIQGFQSPGAGITQRTEIVAGIATDVQGMIPESDMDSVLQYLSRDDMADFVIIRLPETRSFSSSGEPALLKAADYSRRALRR